MNQNTASVFEISGILIWCKTIANAKFFSLDWIEKLTADLKNVRTHHAVNEIKGVSTNRYCLSECVNGSFYKDHWAEQTDILKVVSINNDILVRNVLEAD